MKIKLYDRIRLKDGRTATIVDILKDGIEFIIDVDISKEKWETIEIGADKIESVLGTE